MTLDEEMQERTAALERMDTDYARKLMPHVSAEAREIGMHKCRYESPACSREARHASGAWLRERGYARMTGEPLLPEGELPQ